MDSRAYWKDANDQVHLDLDGRYADLWESRGFKRVDKSEYDAFMGRVSLLLDREDRALLRAALLVFGLEQDKSRSFDLFLSIAQGRGDEDESRFIPRETIHRLYQRLSEE